MHDIDLGVWYPKWSAWPEFFIMVGLGPATFLSYGYMVAGLLSALNDLGLVQAAHMLVIHLLNSCEARSSTDLSSFARHRADHPNSISKFIRTGSRYCALSMSSSGSRSKSQRPLRILPCFVVSLDTSIVLTRLLSVTASKSASTDICLHGHRETHSR